MASLRPVLLCFRHRPTPEVFILIVICEGVDVDYGGSGCEVEAADEVDVAPGNQCARLIANAIIYYNSAILSRLVTKYEAGGNTKALALIKKMSPAAWRHIHLNGHYTFRSDGQIIDLDAIVAGLEVG